MNNIQMIHFVLLMQKFKVYLMQFGHGIILMFIIMENILILLQYILDLKLELLLWLIIIEQNYLISFLN